MRNVLAWVAAMTAEALRHRAGLGSDLLPLQPGADPAAGTVSLILALQADYQLIDGPDGELEAPTAAADPSDIATRRLTDLSSIYGLDRSDAALLTVVVA